MQDPRYGKLARVLVNYSLQIKPGQKVLVFAQALAAPLAREVYREALLAGAHPSVRLLLGGLPVGMFAFDGLTELMLREGSDDQLGFTELDTQEIERYDALLAIWAEENTKALSDIAPKRIALFQQARRPLMERFMERWSSGQLRWCGTLFPTQAHAQDAGMSLYEYEDFVFDAGLLDRKDPSMAWKEMRDELQQLAELLGRYDEIRILAPGTDITYRVGGRTWVDASGINNFPDGEVFTSPIEDSANGTVSFTYPAVYAGNEVADVRLTFRNGEVVEANASRGRQLLQSMLDQDSGARFLGEVAFGMNYGITRFTRNMLFDEKIGGTMHVALGQSFPHTGGQNQSSLHWDMICDLREGKVYADGDLIYKSGRFII